MAQTTRKIAMVMLSIAVLSGCAAAPRKPAEIPRSDYSYTRQYLGWLIPRTMKKHKVTGLSIVLVDDHQTVFARGFGFADKEGQIPAAPDTRYRAGSISKLFTATAIMRLAERGKLDIDQPLQAYLPNFSIKSRYATSAPITLRNMMTHHSGLPGGYIKGMWSRDPMDFDQLANALHDEYTAFPPDQVLAYSNLAYSLLGHVIENVSGQRYSEHMRSTLLDPLGMPEAYFHSGLGNDAKASKGYRKGKPAEIFALRDIPAGGLNASAAELVRLAQMVFDQGMGPSGRILQAETLSEMLRPQNADVQLDFGLPFGLGWALGGLGDIDIRGAGKVAHHGGGTLLFHSQLIVVPQHKLAVAVMANSSSAREAVDQIATEAIQLALEAKAGVKQPEPAPSPQSSMVNLTEQERRAYEGRYATVIGPFRIKPKSQDLVGEWMGNSFALVPEGDGFVRLRYKLLGLIPINIEDFADARIRHRSIAGHEVLTASIGESTILVGQKVPAVALDPLWKRRLGSYRIINTGADAPLFENVELAEHDGFLVLSFDMPLLDVRKTYATLLPVSEDEAVTAGLGGGMGDTLHFTGLNEDETLWYSGYRLQRLAEKRSD